MDPTLVFGPGGAFVVLVFVIGAGLKFIQGLVKDHQASDLRERERGDRLLAITEGMVPALKDLAAGQAAANRDAAERHRRSDDG